MIYTTVRGQYRAFCIRPLMMNAIRLICMTESTKEISVIFILISMLLSVTSFAKEQPKELCEIISSGITLPAQRESFPVKETCYQQNDQLYLQGPIGKKLENTLMTRDNISTLHLNSQGGSISRAGKIADLIRAKKINTNLLPGANCVSACTLLYQAGVKRTATSNNILVYHCVSAGPRSKGDLLLYCGADYENYTDDNQEYKCLTNLNKRIRSSTEGTKKMFNEQHVAKYDMDASFIDWFFSDITNDSKWFKFGNFCKKYYGLTTEQAKEFNIVQKVI